MTLTRAAGILLHPTSLPGPNGVGELGTEAHRFLDFLAGTGITIWQVLPLGTVTRRTNASPRSRAIRC